MTEAAFSHLVEAWKMLGLQPNTEAQSPTWMLNFSKLLSICLNSILFADFLNFFANPFLMKPFENVDDQLLS